MRAAVMTARGKLSVADDVDIEDPGQGEVLVEVRWCSVCHSDLHALDGETLPPLPCVLGHETSGVVRALGPGADSLAAGDHVVLSMIGPCGRCKECLRGTPVACMRAGGPGGLAPDGSTRLSRGGERVWRALRVGGFAELAVVRQEAAVRIAPDVPLDLACVLGCAVQTGYGAVTNIAGTRPGDNVGVVGLGAVGIAAVQAARLARASAVIGIDPLPARRALAGRLGATLTLAPGEADADAVRTSTGGRLLDVIIDTVSTPTTIRQAAGMTGRRGAIVLVGVGSSDLQLGVATADIVMNQKRILGCYLGNCVPRRDIPALVDLWRQGRLDLDAMVTTRRDLADLGEAFEDIRQGRGLRTAVAVSPASVTGSARPAGGNLGKQAPLTA
jgi:S-(hydroxymethyl)glutathione dehydrogenase / alcohol dehydrogenase